jgi:hypothetical protein
MNKVEFFLLVVVDERDRQLQQSLNDVGCLTAFAPAFVPALSQALQLFVR